jgi:hypothetical protein
VQDNFLFYTKLLHLFLYRAIAFDYYASARPVNIKTNPAKTTIVNYLDLVKKVINHFHDPQLVDILRTMESALFSLDHYSNTTSPTLGKNPAHFSVTQTPGKSSNFSRETDFLYHLRNSGPKTRMHVQLLEKKYQYSPIFEGDVSLVLFLNAAN